MTPIQVSAKPPTKRAFCSEASCPWMCLSQDDLTRAALAHTTATGHQVTVIEQRTIIYCQTQVVGDQ